MQIISWQRLFARDYPVLRAVVCQTDDFQSNYLNAYIGVIKVLDIGTLQELITMPNHGVVCMILLPQTQTRIVPQSALLEDASGQCDLPDLLKVNANLVCSTDHTLYSPSQNLKFSAS